VDLLAAKSPTRIAWLNAIGVYFQFHEGFGYYADPVDEKTATLPNGWRGRLVQLPRGNTEGDVGSCLGPHELAIAKYVAFRDKDLVFTPELARRGIASEERLLSLLDQTQLDEASRSRIRDQITRDFHAAQALEDRAMECSPRRPARLRTRRRSRQEQGRNG
jgi:hypothetical protein